MTSSQIVSEWKESEKLKLLMLLLLIQLLPSHENPANSKGCKEGKLLGLKHSNHSSSALWSSPRSSDIPSKIFNAWGLCVCHTYNERGWISIGESMEESHILLVSELLNAIVLLLDISENNLMEVQSWTSHAGVRQKRCRGKTRKWLQVEKLNAPKISPHIYLLQTVLMEELHNNITHGGVDRCLFAQRVLSPIGRNCKAAMVCGSSFCLEESVHTSIVCI